MIPVLENFASIYDSIVVLNMSVCHSGVSFNFIVIEKLHCRMLYLSFSCKMLQPLSKFTPLNITYL